MTSILPKTPRIRFEPDAYSRLHLQVLERDHWRCQHCGSRQHLQVHHQEFRSHSGSDVDENLITLCDACHRDAHRQS